MFEYNNFYQLRSRLSNSACLINSNFGYTSTDSLLPVPNKNNGALISINNKSYALTSSSNLIVKNISKEYIPTKKMTIIKKYTNGELMIDTRNNDNNLISRVKNEYGFEIICGTQKSFIYYNGNFIKSIKYTDKALNIYSLYRYFYIITQKEIIFVNTVDHNLIEISHLSKPMVDDIIISKAIRQTDRIFILLLTKFDIHIIKLPTIVTTLNDEGVEETKLDYKLIRTNNNLKLPSYYSSFTITNFDLILLDKLYLAEFQPDDTPDYLYYLTISSDKFSVFYTFDGNNLIYSDYLDNKDVSNVFINNKHYVKFYNSGKMYEVNLKLGDVSRFINNDIGLPTFNSNISNTYYLDFDNSTEISVPYTDIPEGFSVNNSRLKSVNSLLVLDGGIYGVVHLTITHTLVFYGYIKPFPYYSSTIQKVDNFLYTDNGNYYLLNSYTGLMEYTFSNDINEVTSIDNYLDDDSLFIIPDSVFIKAQKYTDDNVDEKTYVANEIWFDTLFSVIVIPINNDLLNFVSPVPIIEYPYQSLSLNNVSFVYCKKYAFTPLITRVNSLGVNSLTSNYTVVKNKLKYGKLFDIGNVIYTDIDTGGSLLFNINNIPLGLIVNKEKQILVNNKTVSLLIEKHLTSSSIDNINLKYTNTSEISINTVLNIKYSENNGFVKILELEYYKYNNRNVSIMKKLNFPYSFVDHGVIFEIYSLNNEFLGYCYMTLELDLMLNNTVPNYLLDGTYLLLSGIFKTFDEMELDNNITDSETISHFNQNRVKIKPTQFKFLNNKVENTGFKINKINVAPIGINVISINDLTPELFNKILEDVSFPNNLIYQDILVAKNNNLEGFLVTGISNIFKTKNSFELLGAILDKEIVNSYSEYYLRPTIIKYYELMKSIENTTWVSRERMLNTNDYDIELESYSI